MTEFSNEFVNFKIQGGIFYANWLDHLYTINDIDFGIKKRLELSNGKTYPMLSDFRQVKHFANRSCRERLCQQDAKTGINALAVVVKNKIQCIYVSLVIKMNKSEFPVQIFTNYDKAYQWIQQYKIASDE